MHPLQPSKPANASQIVARVCALDREALKRELLEFRGPVRLDFTEEFLSRLSTERLRHILLAAWLCGRGGRLPRTG